MNNNDKEKLKLTHIVTMDGDLYTGLDSFGPIRQHLLEQLAGKYSGNKLDPLITDSVEPDDPAVLMFTSVWSFH